MPPSRRRVLSAVAGAAALAGCIGDDTQETPAGRPETDTPTDTATSTGTATPTDTATQTDAATPTATEGAAGPTVQVREHSDLGEILVGPDGMTLYMFDSDTQGEGASTCYDDCAEAWPPLTVEGEPTLGEGVTAELTTFERDDGEMQVAAAGWPLYYYAPDEEPGDATGQGVGDVWWVLRPDGTPVRPSGSTDAATATPTETDDGLY